MVQAWRAWNRVVLTVAFACWDYVIWRSIIALDTFVLFHFNATPISFFAASRVFITACLFLAWQYFYRHCVVGQREESARIVHRG